MKQPLAIYLLYHSKLKNGSDICDKVYKLLCRDSRNIDTDGLDIPVYFVTGDEFPICNVDFTRAEQVCVLTLVDENMYMSSGWKTYLRAIASDKQEDRNVYFAAVTLCKYAYEINSIMQMHQFFSLESYSILECWQEFQTRIFDALIRFIKKDSGKKVRVFISHSKRDKDKIGEVRAEQVRDFIRKKTKLDSFFDVNDILDGERFDKEIEKGVNESILLVLFSNTYSSREWCRREFLQAKRCKIPVVAVFMLDGDIDRVFPYIGNIPSTVYMDDWRPVVNILLRTALDMYHEDKLLRDMTVGKGGIGYLPFSPEAHSFSMIEADIKTVLYPEPPLGGEELDVLKAIRPGVKFATPMQNDVDGMDLNNRSIAISVSESEDLSSHGMDRKIIDDLIVELSRHLLIAKAHLVYGGDMRKMGYTDMLKDLSYQYGTFEKTDNSVKYFTDYVAWPLHLSITKEQVIEFEHSRVELVRIPLATECTDVDATKYLCPDTTEHQYIWARCLSSMRSEMEKHVDARIVVGGKISGFKGTMAGVVEEVLYAMEQKHPIYIVGGFGGATSQLVSFIEGKQSIEGIKYLASSDSHIKLLELFVKKGIEVGYEKLADFNLNSLNNGLSPEDNCKLFHTTNIMEVVNLILKGLKTIFCKDDGKA